MANLRGLAGPSLATGVRIVIDVTEAGMQPGERQVVARSIHFAPSRVD